MNDEYRQEPADALDGQKGETTEPTGKPTDARNRRHGAIDQDAEEAKDPKPSSRSTSAAAQDEEDRQLETGEENPG